MTRFLLNHLIKRKVQYLWVVTFRSRTYIYCKSHVFVKSAPLIMSNWKHMCPGALNIHDNSHYYILKRLFIDGTMSFFRVLLLLFMDRWHTIINIYIIKMLIGDLVSNNIYGSFGDTLRNCLAFVHASNDYQVMRRTFYAWFKEDSFITTAGTNNRRLTWCKTKFSTKFHPPFHNSWNITFVFHRVVSISIIIFPLTNILRLYLMISVSSYLHPLQKVTLCAWVSSSSQSSQ